MGRRYPRREPPSASVVDPTDKTIEPARFTAARWISAGRLPLRSLDSLVETPDTCAACLSIVGA